MEMIVTFTVVGCAECAMSFAVPARFDTDRRNDHGRFYCPAGHGNIYRGKSEKEALEAQLKRERADKQYFEDRLTEVYDEKRGVERRLSAQKGQVTRIKNRVGKGVCPCCNRTFQDLARHMKGQHPDFTTTSTRGADGD